MQVVSNEIFKPGRDRRAVPGAPLRSETLEELMEHGYEPDEFAGERSWHDDFWQFACGVGTGGDSGWLTAPSREAGKARVGARAARPMVGRLASRPRVRTGRLFSVVVLATRAWWRLLTRWPVAAVVRRARRIGIAPPFSGPPMRSKRRTARTEAIAAWTELFRDTLAAASGLSQAIIARLRRA